MSFPRTSIAERIRRSLNRLRNGRHAGPGEDPQALLVRAEAVECLANRLTGQSTGAGHSARSVERALIATESTLQSLVDDQKVATREVETVPKPPVQERRTVPQPVPDLIRLRDQLTSRGSMSPESVPSLLDGIDRRLVAILEALDVDVINADGAFDTSAQEVVHVEPTTNSDLDEHIHSTVRSGYRFDGKLIRPQQVIVYQYQELA